MHETGVCRSIVETVEQFALAHGATSVKSVHITMGAMHDIVPDILEGAFAWMAQGTVVEGAQMVIERIPFTVKCQRCGEVYELDGRDEDTWSCPACHARDYRLNTGREFMIDEIEIGYSSAAA
jgi:hydrogenase nickel incorporation protein HypA/HybF